MVWMMQRRSNYILVNMQTDFHHAVTYVLSRLAGFPHDQANVIAYSAQYVDDATSSGVVYFKNKAMYQRISSAHKTIALDNLCNTDNYITWLPFHFLPANGGREAGQDPNGSFIQKIICKPDSLVAREMLAVAFQDRNTARALHRLGIAMHVFADTWSHQGFAGVLHEINDVDEIFEEIPSGLFEKTLWGRIKEWFAERVPATGHGQANVLPDLPFQKWSYKSSAGYKIYRDNTSIFMQATVRMYEVLYQYRNPEASVVPPMGQVDRDLIEHNLSTFTDLDEWKRHQAWLQCIAQGEFSFGAATVHYAARGSGSWKELALGCSEDLFEHPYTPAFLASDWKLFHDALQAHRLSVLHDILPRYGICAG